MAPLSIVVVYHPNCKASTDFLILVSKLTDAEIEYINIKDVSIQTEIDVDVVPLMIIDNDPSKIFKGKYAFDKVDELINKPRETAWPQEVNGLQYGKTVKFIEDSGKKEKIDLSIR